MPVPNPGLPWLLGGCPTPEGSLAEAAVGVAWAVMRQTDLVEASRSEPFPIVPTLRSAGASLVFSGYFGER